MIRVLVVDDSALVRRLLGGLFEEAGDFQVDYARTGGEALAKMRSFQPQVVTLDVHMPEMDGLTCLNRIMLEHPCPVVMLSSLTGAGAEITLKALDLGAVDFVAKPTGAISLKMDTFGPLLIDKVRAASQARLRKSHRLAERVRRHHAGRDPRPPAASSTAASVPATPASAPAGSPSPQPFDKVVVIGTSTGGPPALDALLQRLPSGFPAPVLVAQHMPASFTGALARRLDRQCAMSVVEVTGPVVLSAGTVYIGRGDADIIVSARHAGLTALSAPADPDYLWHPSVDRLVTSAMQHVAADRMIGILMTGMGHDGASSMTGLLRSGGRTIAEAEETAVVWGMPGELVRAGGASCVAPLDEIADRLLAMVATP